MTSPSARLATVRKVISRNAWLASGKATIMTQPVAAAATKPTMNSGVIIRKMLTPHACRATVSRSLESRPSPIRTPSSIAIGIVMPSPCGRRVTMIFRIVTPSTPLAIRSSATSHDRRDHQQEREHKEPEYEGRDDLTDDVAIDYPKHRVSSAPSTATAILSAGDEGDPWAVGASDQGVGFPSLDRWNWNLFPESNKGCYVNLILIHS